MSDQNHILVVDDDHEIRELLTDYLRDAGFEYLRRVMVAKCGGW
ncbi:hypothetical protein [Methylobacillus arboreus]|nr:hypothetical protein [Methylobacillus arboreus]